VTHQAGEKRGQEGVKKIDSIPAVGQIWPNMLGMAGHVAGHYRERRQGSGTPA